LLCTLGLSYHIKPTIFRQIAKHGLGNKYSSVKVVLENFGHTVYIQVVLKSVLSQDVFRYFYLRKNLINVHIVLRNTLYLLTGVVTLDLIWQFQKVGPTEMPPTYYNCSPSHVEYAACFEYKGSEVKVTYLKIFPNNKFLMEWIVMSLD